MPAPSEPDLTLLRWYVEKETKEGWTPYHVGTTPSGAQCRTMPRVVLARPGVYRCPSCGKEFPTFTALLAEARSAQVT